MDEIKGDELVDTVGQLLAVLAHEVRNPLGNMTNVVALLENSPQDAGLVQEGTQIMKRQIGRIARLVEDLFDLSAIDQGKMRLNLEVVSVNHLMDVAVADTSCEIESKNHKFSLGRLPKDAKVRVDVNRLTQVFCNLLSNAAKYTPDHGHIRFGAELEGDMVVFSVQDNGIGLHPDSLDSVFRIYSQERRASGASGLGLGLALVKKLVSLHGGEVGARSDGPGKGSLFYVSLPVHDEPEESMPERSESDETKKVLIVEDNESAANALKKIMELEGSYDVRVAYTGREGVRDAIDFVPDVIVLDLSLPDMSGQQVADHIKAELPGVCIVVVTGYPKPAAPDPWYDFYVCKPLDFTRFFEIISSCRAIAA